VTAFNLVDGAIRYQKGELFEDSIKMKMKLVKSGVHSSCVLHNGDVKDAVLYARRLWERQYEFEYADLVSCIVMNYQDAILHNQQHAAASLALNFSVLESLVKEMFYFYGILSDKIAKPYETVKHKIQKIGEKKFDKMPIKALIEKLHDGGLIDSSLYGRIEDARIKRNSLMHKGKRVSPNDSGHYQTVVRDLWKLLIDQPFELNAGWSYRR